jgi:hypothetical protein
VSLPSVAARIRVLNSEWLGGTNTALIREEVLKQLEADPDWSLRERVEAIATELDRECANYYVLHSACVEGYWGKRLREALSPPKPKEGG